MRLIATLIALAIFSAGCSNTPEENASVITPRPVVIICEENDQIEPTLDALLDERLHEIIERAQPLVVQSYDSASGNFTTHYDGLITVPGGNDFIREHTEEPYRETVHDEIMTSYNTQRTNLKTADILQLFLQAFGLKMRYNPGEIIICTTGRYFAMDQDQIYVNDPEEWKRRVTEMFEPAPGGTAIVLTGTVGRTAEIKEYRNQFLRDTCEALAVTCEFVI